MQNLAEVLGQILVQVNARTGSAAPLNAVWASVVSPTISRRARPVKLERGHLELEAERGWADALSAEIPDLIAALNARLGADTIVTVSVVRSR